MKKILSVFAIIAVIPFSWMAMSPPPSPHELYVDQDYDGTVVLYWRGVIDPPMARALNHTFSQMKEETRTFKLVLDSPGGNVAEGERVIKALRRLSRTHDVVTFVEAESQCLSMCVPIFLAGEERLASPKSLWMFHEPYPVNPVTGQPDIVFQNERNIRSMTFFSKYYRDSVLNEEWAAKLEDEWRDGDVWKTGRELWREKSGALTELSY